MKDIRYKLDLSHDLDKNSSKGLMIGLCGAKSEDRIKHIALIDFLVKQYNCRISDEDENNDYIRVFGLNGFGAMGLRRGLFQVVANANIHNGYIKETPYCPI